MINLNFSSENWCPRVNRKVSRKLKKYLKIHTSLELAQAQISNRAYFFTRSHGPVSCSRMPGPHLRLQKHCFLKKLSEVRKLTTLYFAKNDHRWVIFICLKTSLRGDRVTCGGVAGEVQTNLAMVFTVPSIAVLAGGVRNSTAAPRVHCARAITRGRAAPAASTCFCFLFFFCATASNWEIFSGRK